MPSAFDDHWGDANEFLSEEFAESITLNDLSRDIPATVDIPVALQNFGRMPSELADPQFTARDKDLLGVQKDQLVTVRGDSYRIVKMIPDGTGWSNVTIAPDQVDFVNDFAD